MKPIHFISAVGTPLTENQTLHIEGLESHLAAQWEAGIHGVLVAGTMGMMQLLTDRTWRELVGHAVRLCPGRGELMIGIGDTSLARSLERIAWTNRFGGIDGVVALPPFFIHFTPQELFDYYTALADASHHRLYLYHLPGRTGVRFEVEMVLRLAEHPNIAGIKASGEPQWTADLIARNDNGFRIIVAQPDATDTLLQQGIAEHLDGLFALAPRWTVELGQAAAAGDWELARGRQHRLMQLLQAILKVNCLPAFSAILNELGTPGNFAPAPFRPLTPEQQDELFQIPVVRQLLDESASVPQPPATQAAGTLAPP